MGGIKAIGIAVKIINGKEEVLAVMAFGVREFFCRSAADQGSKGNGDGK